MLFHSLSQLGRARLSRTLTLWVFGSFMVIEIIVLIPSYLRRQTELETQLADLYPATVLSELETLSETTTFLDWPGLAQIQSDPQITGIALYGDRGQGLGQWGNIPRLSATKVMTLPPFQHWSNYYLVSWQAPDQRRVVLAIDHTPIQQELYAYAGRILGLIALIGIVITVATMVGLEMMVIQPIVQLRRELLQFGLAIQEQDVPQFQPTVTHVPQNELGDVMLTFAQLCDRVITEINQRREAIAVSHQARQQSTQLQEKLVDLQQHQLLLIRNEKMLSLEQMVAGLAHELNNPLTFIGGNLNHVEEYFDSLLQLVQCYETELSDAIPAVETCKAEIDLPFIQGDVSPVIKSLKNGVVRIQTIVESLRSFARLDESEQKTVDIHSGLEQCLVILEHRLQVNDYHPAITVHKDYGDLPLIECYHSQLNQVFLSLLTNAIDSFTDPTQSDCMITLQTRLLTGDRIQILIADNGCGIKAAVQDKVFDPFFTTKPVGSGTGMGLAIAYQVIHHNHGGEFELRSQPNVGTECWLELPLRLPS